MLPTKFRFIWPSGFRVEDFLEIDQSDKTCLWWPCLLMDRDKLSNLYREPSINASYQVSVHMAEGFQRKRSPVARVGENRQTGRITVGPID